jgi:hypothetical protein
MAKKTWDLFISHASEDKESVARPLATELRRGGARVWLDEQELLIGDSLTEKIDEGLSRSAFGVVVLSRAFFERHWPRRELAGLRAREEDGRKTILPVWHGVDKATVAGFSPILADALAADTASGIDRVARLLLAVVFDDTSDAPSKRNPTVVRRFVELLDSPSNVRALVAFLRIHTQRVYLGWGGVQEWQPLRIGGVEFDAYAPYVGHGARLTLVTFTPVWADPFVPGTDGAPVVHSAIAETVSAMRSVGVRVHEDADVQDCVRLALESLDLGQYGPDNPEVHFVLYGGRRRYIDADRARHDAWSRLRNQDHSISVRTYDSLVDEFLRQ